MTPPPNRLLYAKSAMAKLRLFANLREIAGTGKVDIPATTVQGVVEAASEKFGPDFGRALETTRVWVNGDEASLDDEVDENDEVVLLPPVSGGSQPAVFAPADLIGFLPLVVAIVAVLANTMDQPIWAAAVVAIGSVWAIDLAGTFAVRGRHFAPLAVVTAVSASTLTAHILGPSGYGLAIALAVAAVLGWAVAFPQYRQVESFAPTALVALIGALAAGSLVLSRSSFTPDESAVDVLLVGVIAAIALGALVSRLPALPYLDRFSVTAVGAVIATVVAATIWDLDGVGYLLVGLGIAVALVAGQGLSSMLRTGRVTLTEQPPGMLAVVDGAMLAAAIYFPLIRLVLTG